MIYKNGKSDIKRDKTDERRREKEEIRARAGERSGRDQSEEKRRSERSGTGVQGRAPVIEKRTAGTSGRQRARKRRRRGRKMLSRSNSGKKNAGQRKEKTQGESGLARSLRFFVVRVKRRKPLKFYIAVMYSVIVVCFASCLVFQAKKIISRYAEEKRHFCKCV